VDISINEDSAIPVYKQIIIQVLSGLLKNRITINTPLPTIRQLALDLSLTPTTIAKAYQILERGKIIATGGRRGTFIHENAVGNAARFLQEEVQNQVDEFVSLQLKYGVSLDELKKSFQATIDKYAERGAS
jgi:GntR family transcriptional regulator